jgi:voltage-gated potassium channel
MNDQDTKAELVTQRTETLERFQQWMDVPMLVLAFIWLALFVAEILLGLTPFLVTSGYVIWIIFIVEFAVGFILAPGKVAYLTRNWLKGIALLLPALRIFRVVQLLRLARLTRVAGMARGARLVRVISSLNRGMRALGASMSRRGFGYVMILTLTVLIVGAAGMFEFERSPGGRGLTSYGESLWWTAMLMTTIASEYWPVTGAGRFLCLLLSLYGIAVFGYVTAALASFFVGRDAEDDHAEVAGEKSIAALRREIGRLSSGPSERGRDAHDLCRHQRLHVRRRTGAPAQGGCPGRLPRTGGEGRSDGDIG